ncbi:MAG: histone deacetylase [Bacteriovoracaceae bacterium]|nr:histone deacetylase [Bacteriovoracaceae bacterium]
MTLSREILVYHSDHYDLPLPEGHRFPMEKYKRVRKALTEANIIRSENIQRAPLAKKEDILLVHTETYYHAIEFGTLEARDQRKIGFPWSDVMLNRSRASVGGFLAAVDSALINGVSGNLSGGTHHSFPDRGEGFCVFNDFAVAAKKLIKEKNFQNILVIDLDVHQGNGNAAILTPLEEVFVVSMHGASNYPYIKPSSDWDIPLEDNTSDEVYLENLDYILQKLSLRSWDIILYQAGVDPLKEDKLGRLSLSHVGLYQRDYRVLKFAKERNIPIALGLGGGYSLPIDHTVEAHLNTYKAVASLYNL